MARPQILQKLRHGKILCKNAFPLFAETFNWVTTAFDNLVGDFDKNRKCGFITVDKRDGDHPVIRFRTDNLNKMVGVGYAGCFEIDSIDDGAITFKNTWYRVGGRTYETNQTSGTFGDGIICLEIKANTAQPTATLNLFGSLTALQNAEKDLSKYIIPLYTLENGNIVCDWRKGAEAIMTEF